MMARTIEVKIVADTSQLERALRRAEMVCTRSWWRRTLLKIALWRTDRKVAS